VQSPRKRTQNLAQRSRRPRRAGRQDGDSARQGRQRTRRAPSALRGLSPSPRNVSFQDLTPAPGDDLDPIAVSDPLDVPAWDEVERGAPSWEPRSGTSATSAPFPRLSSDRSACRGQAHAREGVPRGVRAAFETAAKRGTRILRRGGEALVARRGGIHVDIQTACVAPACSSSRGL
jgi:hypothetical protein